MILEHSFSLEGYGYRLRPIKLSDAQFILETRLEDAERNKYIHTVANDVHVQVNWLKEYFKRDGDYYFVVENRLNGAKEGLISFYDQSGEKAEWGRWVIKKGSMASVESVYLLYRIAFEQAGLEELYCRTIADNKSVVSFHSSIGELTRCVLKNHEIIDDTAYDSVEQYSNRQNFYKIIAPALEKKSQLIFKRNINRYLGKFEFHHIGIAVRSIEKELKNYTLLGYIPEKDCFEDSNQGVRGLFLTAQNQPTLELLENLPNSDTLDAQLNSGQKMYHIAFFTEKIENAIECLRQNKAHLISPLKQSEYFRKRICFVIMPNMQMIELIEI